MTLPDKSTVDLTPSPEAYVNTLIFINQNSPNEEDRKFAREELVRAMTIAMGVKEEMNDKRKT